MKKIIGAEAATLAGLQIDMLQRLRSGNLQLEHMKWFLNLRTEERETLFKKSKKKEKDNNIISIPRNRFNPTEFIGKGWSIIAEETDTRSIDLTELDLTKVQMVTMLKDGETVVNGEEKLKRLKASGYIRLDADIFLMLWENQYLIPESWKEKVNGDTRCIFFDGTVLRDSGGNRFVLYLYWNDGAWLWRMFWLDNNWNDSSPSAVLAS